MIAVFLNRPMPKITRKVGMGVQEKDKKRKKRERNIAGEVFRKIIIRNQVAGKRAVKQERGGSCANDEMRCGETIAKGIHV